VVTAITKAAPLTTIISHRTPLVMNPELTQQGMKAATTPLRCRPIDWSSVDDPLRSRCRTGVSNAIDRTTAAAGRRAHRQS
jgi:hypothetical protein